MRDPSFYPFDSHSADCKEEAEEVYINELRAGIDFLREFCPAPHFDNNSAYETDRALKVMNLSQDEWNVTVEPPKEETAEERKEREYRKTLDY